MGMRTCQLRTFDLSAGAIVIEPILARLEAGDHRVSGDVKMLAGVLVRRRIATADVPAFGAASQVQPPTISRQALDTAVSTRSDFGIYSRTANMVLHCTSAL